MSGFLHTWNWMPSRFNISWKSLFKNVLPLSVRTQVGRRLRLEYLESWNTDRISDATTVPYWTLERLDVKMWKRHLWRIGCTCTCHWIYCEHERPLDRIHRRPSRYLPIGLSEKRFLISLWTVYPSCLSNQSLISTATNFYSFSL